MRLGIDDQDVIRETGPRKSDLLEHIHGKLIEESGSDAESEEPTEQTGEVENDNDGNDGNESDTFDS